ncbi:hypothetical protein C8J56DRAFT_918713 [Mycena floridula]|nr:hypothetical protein C8J56DRAFT_918713 [Mycena floridula]
MCGRFALGSRQAVDEMQGYDVQVGEWVNEEHFIPRHNIAPHSMAPVIRRSDPGSSRNNSQSDKLVMHTMRWGLVPNWFKFEDKSLNTTNARSENLIQGGGMWNSIKGKRRCAVLCQGYYEWLTKGKDKLPHFVKHKDGKLMLMAGLYDSVVLEGQTEQLYTFSIVTTAAAKDFAWLHERQPVILSSDESLRKWLDTSSQKWTDDLEDLLAPYSDTLSPLECYQVPKEVGKVGNESSTFIEPAINRIQAMFSKQKQSHPPIASSSTKPKRKRSTTPPPVEDSDSDVVILDTPPAKKKAPSSKSKSPEVSKRQKSKQSTNKTTLDSFFSK